MQQKVLENFGLRTLRAAENQFKKPSAESDDPATLSGLEHESLAFGRLNLDSAEAYTAFAGKSSTARLQSAAALYTFTVRQL